MIDFDPISSALLSRARRGLSPTQSDHDRVRQAVLAAPAVNDPAPGATDSVSAYARWPLEAGNITSAARRSVAWTARLLVASAIAVSAGSTGYWLGYKEGAREAPASGPASAPLPPVRPGASLSGSVSKTATGGRDDRPAFESGLPQRTTSVRPAKGATPESAGESLEKELSALRGVERALRDGQPHLALALLRELARTVPAGKLAEEREATTAIARCAAGDAPFDVDLADDFAARYPGSVYLKRVNQACAGIGNTGGSSK